MKEQWNHWEPVDNQAISYYIASITYDTPGLTILLAEENNNNKRVSILFDAHIASYVFTDFTHRSNKSKYAQVIEKDQKFFTILNSNYLQRLSIQSCGISDTRDLIHFAIVALDGIIEVASPFEPIICEFEDITEVKILYE